MDKIVDKITDQQVIMVDANYRDHNAQGLAEEGEKDFPSRRQPKQRRALGLLR